MFLNALRFLEQGARFYSDPLPGPQGGSPAGGAGGGVDLLAQAQRQLDAQSGNALNVISGLLQDVHAAREARRQAEAKIPPPGSVVIDEKQAAAWAAYQALGAPDEIKTKIEAGSAAAEENRGYRLLKAANAAGADPGVLETIGATWDYVIEDEKDDAGAPIKAVYVKDGDRKIALRDHVESKAPRLLPVLFVDSQAGDAGQGSAAQKKRTSTRSVPLPTKGGSGGAAQGGTGDQSSSQSVVDQMADEFAKARASRPSLLDIAANRAKPVS